MAVARAHHHSTARFITVSARYKEFLEDLLANFGPVSIRNLFSGAGVSAEGVMFAIVVNDTFYLKADAVSARDFAAEGKTPFASRRKGRGRSPCDRVLEDPEELAVWARRAHAIAVALAAKAKPKQRRSR